MCCVGGVSVSLSSLQLQTGDSQLLLVALSQSIEGGHSHTVYHLLQQHTDVVKALGWDLLSLLTPHLPHTFTPSPISPIWQLITLISEVCSAKEMCLAFLEQLELVSSSPALFFHLLTPLLIVMERLGVGDEKRQSSTLRSVRSMVTRVYPTLEEDQLSPLIPADLVLALVEPFTAHIHHKFTSSTVQLQTFWSPLQTECVSLLLTLLGQPLVAHDLREGSESRRTAEAIMVCVVQCHCGCLQLLETGAERNWKTGLRDMEEGDSSSHSDIPLVGVACFVYLVLVEGVQSNYLPSPLHPHHLLHTSLTHTLTLLQRQERHSILKGLALLETVLGRVAADSLSQDLLTDHHYLNTAQRLVDIMVTCPHKKLRQKCVVLLASLISRFTAHGRYRLYRSLLRGSGHAGVQGLLIHSLKNEVDQALLSGAVSSPFLAPDLIPILREVLTFSADSELLRETDRVMAILNFLRYLLIRDKADSNRTGVWDVVEEVRSKCISQLRQSLERDKLQLRGERVGTEGGGERAEVSVEVEGEELPNISHEEHTKLLQLAEHHLDMMECVLVRVEELLDQRS